MYNKLFWGFLILPSFMLFVGLGCANVKNGQVYFNSNEGLKEDFLIMYNDGERKLITSRLPNFNEVKNIIERFAETAGDTYKMVVEKKAIERVRNKGTAIELMYASPKTLKVEYFAKNFNKESITVKSIFIPLSKGSFPEDVLFVFTDDQSFYMLQNKGGNKEELLQMLEGGT